MTQSPDNETSELPRLYDVWEKYEEVAMHFNDLLIRLRTRALGVVAVISALITVFGRIEAPGVRNGVLAGVFTFLCFFWIAIWVLDFGYYNLLLRGAVDALIDIEDMSKRTNRVQSLDLSHKIEAAVTRSGGSGPRARGGRWLFYVIVFIPLVAAAVVTSVSYFRGSG